MKYWIFLSIIIIILIIIVHHSYRGENVSLNEKFLYGLWAADETFCEQCDSDSFMLFIGEPNDKSSRNKVCRDAYLVVTPDIANEKIEITYSKPRLPKDKYKFAVTNTSTLLPTEVDFEIDIITGLLKISKDGTVYALLYKNNEVTDIAKNQLDE